MSKINKIIVEGPDCSGKSTVVDRVKNTLRWDSKSLHHKSGDQFMRYLKEYALGENIVFDRGHFSELVYSVLWREGRIPFTEEKRKVLDSIASYKSLIIFSCPSLETMQARYNERDFEQQIKFEELEESRELFIKRLEDVPHILYKSESYRELELLVHDVEEAVF